MSGEKLLPTVSCVKYVITSHGDPTSSWFLPVATPRKELTKDALMKCRWGICERHGPKQYDFKAYIELFKKARKHALKVQAVMSFHAGGGNVGDGSCDIPLPPWVMKVQQAPQDLVVHKSGSEYAAGSRGCFTGSSMLRIFLVSAFTH